HFEILLRSTLTRTSPGLRELIELVGVLLGTRQADDEGVHADRTEQLDLRQSGLIVQTASTVGGAAVHCRILALVVDVHRAGLDRAGRVAIAVRTTVRRQEHETFTLERSPVPVGEVLVGASQGRSR